MMTSRYLSTLEIMLMAATLSTAPTQSMQPEPSSVNVDSNADLLV